MSSNKLFIILFIVSIQTISNSQPQPIPAEIRNKFELQQLSPHLLADTDWYCWGFTCFHWSDDKFHGYYARWPKAKGFAAWMTHCEIAHAVSDKPEGPFKTTGTVIKSRNLTGWDIVNAHNPSVCIANEKIHLYYISNKLKGEFNATIENPWPSEQWLIKNRKLVRNRQCIGVAISNTPQGPFKRSPDPVVEPDNKLFKNIAVNPAVTFRDGKFVMIAKGDDPGHKEWFRIQLVGHSENASGPFIFQKKPIYDKAQTEDACIWYNQTEKLFHSIFHVMGKPALAHLISKDGYNWEEAGPFTFMKKQFELTDGEIWKPARVERPFVLTDDNGQPQWIYLAVFDKAVCGNIAVPLMK